MAGLLPAAKNPHICSGRRIVPGLCAVPLPQLRTHSPRGAVVRRRPRPLTRSGLEWQACLPGKMRAGYREIITSGTLRGRDIRLICNSEVIPLEFVLIRGPDAGSVACDENREMLRGTADMALGMYFTPSSFTPARYDDTLKRLEDAGAGSPPGRLYHVAMEADGLIQVLDVWESEASFEAFGKTLLPIMADLGADPGQPQVSPVHNIIKG